ncbi:MAG: TonB-dependent receptor plug domain-containing protein, partial [Vicinamibacteria bacterium]
MTIRVRKHRRKNAPTRWLATGALVAYGALGGRTADRLYADTPSFAENVGPADGQQPVRRFEIPAGALGAALDAYRQASGVAVEVAADVADIQARAVSGSFTPEQALRQLLQGTGVAYRFTTADAVVLELRLRETVDVTAILAKPESPKYTEPLRDIPQTITVVPQAVIAAQGVSTLRDVLRNVTGISMQAGEGGVPAGDNLSIRGFNARTDLFVDGVRDFGGYSRDPVTLEQVEVTKGPGSTYTGRGAT